MSRPKIGSQVSRINSKMQEATLSTIKVANKIIKFIKGNETHITIPPPHFSSTKVVMSSDADFINISNDCSQGGYLVFLADKNNTSCPIS